MHGVDSADDLISDPIRLGFVQRALDSASLIIQTQYESEAFRQSFHYTMVRSNTHKKQIYLVSSLRAEMHPRAKIIRITTAHLHTTP
jgi:hypothetical protein